MSDVSPSMEIRGQLQSATLRKLKSMKRPTRRLENKNTCLTKCVATFFGLNSNLVPFFIGYKDWVLVTKKYFRDRGYSIQVRPYKPSLLRHKSKVSIVQGLAQSSRAKDSNVRRWGQLEHVVLYVGNKPFWDPIGGVTGKFLRGKPRWVWIIKKL